VVLWQLQHAILVDVHSAGKGDNRHAGAPLSLLGTQAGMEITSGKCDPAVPSHEYDVWSTAETILHWSRHGCRAYLLVSINHLIFGHVLKAPPGPPAFWARPGAGAREAPCFSHAQGPAHALAEQAS
jgi:hypothetical protein